MPKASLLVLAGTAIVLVVLAVNQYRWIGEISEAEEKRQKGNVETAAARLAEDFDGELRLLSLNRRAGPSDLNLEGDVSGQLARQYDQWTSSSQHPTLLKDLFLAEIRGPGQIDLLRFDPQSRSLQNVEWPVEFSEFRNAAAAESSRGGRRGPGGRGVDGSGLEHIPALSFSITRRPGPPEFGGPGGRGFRDPPGLAGWEIVRLDRAIFTETFLPSLVQRHFSKQGDFDYDILIVENGSGAVAYRSSPNLALADLRHDADARIRLTGDDFGRPQRGGPPRGDRFGGPGGPNGASGNGPVRGWELYAKHHSGSLQSFADQFRRRNLIISFGVLAVLAMGIGFTFLWSERVRAVGRMQLEFAAGLSHELRTPLAVIRSAGYNLAAGNVTGGSEVVRYGKVLQEQGLRLSDMVEQALLFAQAQSGRGRYERLPVDVCEVIDRAIEACQAVLPKYPCEISARIAPDLPLAATDPNALDHCLHNLLMNALKYGLSPGRISVTAQSQPAPGPAGIEIAVENVGAPIDASDMQHIFEPFFRGRNTSGVSGSGLGLYIVKSIIGSLGGQVDVVSSEAITRFTLRIPAMQQNVQA